MQDSPDYIIHCMFFQHNAEVIMKILIAMITELSGFSSWYSKIIASMPQSCLTACGARINWCRQRNKHAAKECTVNLLY